MLRTTKANLIIRGIIFAVLGVLCLMSPKGTLDSIAWVIGAILIVAAVVTFFMGRDKGAGHTNTIHLIAAILMAVVGLLIIIRPQIIAILLGVFIFFEGIDFTITATRYRRAGIKYWWLLLTLGLLVTLLGLWAICTPWVGATMLSLIIGIAAIGMAVDCFAALAGLTQVERFFTEIKEVATTKADDSAQFEEAKIVE